MRIFSGIQPTGRKHLGNYIGAIRQYVAGQQRAEREGGESIYCIVDLHALSVAYDPAELRERLYDTTAILIAAGLDPGRCVLFRQSDVREHTELTWLLSAVTAHGRPQPHDPVQGQVGQAARAGVRGALPLSRAAGRRRARVQGRRGARGRRPAPARRADARDRPAVQRALCPRHPDPGRAGAPDPRDRWPGDGPAGPDREDVDHRRHRAGDGPGAGPGGRGPQEGDERRDRLGLRGRSRRGQGGDRQPDRGPLGHPRGRAGGDRARVRGLGIRRLQARRGRCRGRVPGAGARALRPAARRRGRARGDPGRRGREGPRDGGANRGRGPRRDGRRPAPG